MTRRDHLADVRTALAAASTASRDVAAIYTAVARNAFIAAQTELKELEHSLVAREAELARATQLSLEGGAHG